MLVVCLQFLYSNVVLEIFRILQKTCVEKRGLFLFFKISEKLRFFKIEGILF